MLPVSGSIARSKTVWTFTAVLSWLVFCHQVVVSAQEVPEEGSTSQPQTSRQLHDDPLPPGALERIDNIFKAGVDHVGRFLFYRLGREVRTYVIYQPQTQYVRDRNSNGPFERIGRESSEPDRISPEDVELLGVQNRLTPGMVLNGERQYYRLGKWGDQPVEYITLKGDRSAEYGVRYGDKLILNPQTGDYQKLGPKRDLLTETVIPASQVLAWGESGALLANADATGPAQYLQHEDVNGVPIVVGWLIAGSIFFTLYMQFFNIWGVRHAVNVVRGKYDNPSDAGEVTHFQALASALSGTVGLGNIAGVTIAMCIGGPGAFFWMLLSGFLGMSTKFVECTLGVKYRKVLPDGSVLGGPMRYLWVGLAEKRVGLLGAFLSISFTIMCIFASFGGGNMLQANQSGSALLHVFQHQDLEKLSQLNARIHQSADHGDIAALRELQQERQLLEMQIDQFQGQFKVVYGAVLALMVGVVIIGGIRRIGAAAEKLVPGMCLIYMSVCLTIIARHMDRIPEVIGLVLSEAFTGQAVGGGVVGALVMGVQRACFSNEAGAGSAPIAHSAAKTEEPIREGCVALLEPFIDTIVICSMTAMVILVTGAWDNDEWILNQGLQGAALTSKAFEQEVSWFPLVLGVAVTLFAYSTIISWSYYGERSWAFLFGTGSTVIYKILTIVCVFIGAVVNLGSVIDFSDMMILGMAFPNILGVAILAPQIKRDLAEYWGKYKRGEFPSHD